MLCDLAADMFQHAIHTFNSLRFYVLPMVALMVVGLMAYVGRGFWREVIDDIKGFRKQWRKHRK